MPTIIAVIVALVGVGIGATFGVFQMSHLNCSALDSQDIHPVAVPFKENGADCEKSSRKWQDDTCIDYEHNPGF